MNIQKTDLQQDIHLAMLQCLKFQLSPFNVKQFEDKRRRCFSGGPFIGSHTCCMKMLSPTYTKAFHEQPPVCDSDVGYQQHLFTHRISPITPAVHWSHLTAEQQNTSDIRAADVKLDFHVRCKFYPFGKIPFSGGLLWKMLIAIDSSRFANLWQWLRQTYDVKE